jgi:hypothetical protein
VNPRGMERRALARTPREDAPTKQQLRRHLSSAGRQPVQIRLDLPPVDAGHEAIQNRAFDPAELDLRFVVNTLRREPMHWWLYTPAGRYQRELLERLGWWAA